ncbi:MAG: methyltransferase domain-containing protein [Pseudomonadota bacterium]
MTEKSTTSIPRPFARDLLAARRARAECNGFRGKGDFMHREVGEAIADRLSMVNRGYDRALVIGAGAGAVNETVRARASDVDIIDMSPERAVAAGARLVDQLDVLDAPQGSFDLVVSVLELHWSNDPVGELIQMRRALRPDGLMLAALWGGRTLHELRTALAEAEVVATGGISPRIAPMAEIREMGGLLQRAGFAMPVADSETTMVYYPDPVALMLDLRRMGETNIMTERRRNPMRRDMLAHAASVYQRAFSRADGRIRATFETIFLSGWAPADGQPVPKQPGSAGTRLADALSTEERKLPH